MFNKISRVKKNVDDKIMIRKLDYVFVLIAVLSQSASLFLGKSAALYGHGIYRYINVFFVGSIVTLGIQAIVWQQALKRIPLSIAYPMMSLVFVVILLLSFLVFKENVTFLQVVGTFLILVGTIVMNIGSKNEN
ncbi:MAG: EamA family transporter [Spirochaetaceae bacterium]